MRNAMSATALACLGLAALSNVPADAHVVIGARVFPVTLTFDDLFSNTIRKPIFNWQEG